MQLDRLRLTEPVAEIRIAVAKTELLECRQGELFESSAGRDDPRALAMLVDRLSSRLGRQCVLHAQLSSDPQPEEACRYQPLVGNESTRRPDHRMPQKSGAGRHADRRSPRGKNKELLHEERHFKWSQRPLRLGTCADSAHRGGCRAGWAAPVVHLGAASGARWSQLGTRTDRDRLVARPRRATRLLPCGNHRRPPPLAFSPPQRRPMVLARRF